MTRRDTPAVRRSRGWSSARRGAGPETPQWAAEREALGTSGAPPQTVAEEARAASAAAASVLGRVLRWAAILLGGLVAIPILFVLFVFWMTASQEIDFVAETAFTATPRGFAAATQAGGGCSIRTYDIAPEVAAELRAGAYGGYAAPERFAGDWRPSRWVERADPAAAPWAADVCSAQRGAQALELLRSPGARVATLVSLELDRMALLIVAPAAGELLTADFSYTDQTLGDIDQTAPR